MGDSLSTSFCDMFGIAKIKRRPMREEVSGLYVRTLKLPKSDEAEAIRLLLQDARNAVYGQAGTNAERQKSIDDADKLCKQARPKLEKLEAARAPQTDAPKIAKRNPTKQDSERADAVRKALDELVKKIDAAAAPSGKARVIMPDSMSRISLLGEVERVRISIDTDIVDVEGAKYLKKEISLLDQKIQVAEYYAENQRRIAWETQTWGVKEVMSTLDKLEMGLDRFDTPLSDKLTAMFEAAESKTLNPLGLANLKAEVEKELAKIGTDYKGYANNTRAAAAEARRVKDGLKTFNEKVSPKLEELRMLGEPFGGDSYRALYLRADQNRASIAAPVAPRATPPDPAKLTADTVKAIDAAIDAVRKQADTLRQDATKQREALTAEINKVADTRKQAAFAADWKQIDAMTASIDRQMPPGETTGEAIANMAAARPLMQSVLTLVQALQSDAPGLAGFDDKLADLEKRVQDASAGGQPLKEYFDKDLTTISADIEKLKKALPTSKAKANATALAKVTKTFEDKLKETQELATYIKGTVEPELQRTSALYREADGPALLAILPGVGLPTPNALKAALDAVAKELQRRPPVEADLKKSVQALTDAFKEVKKAEDATRIATTSNTEKKDQAKAKKEQDEATRQTLEKRLYGLKLQLDEARAAVKEANGDKNAIAAIERLCEEAASHIDAVKPDEANRAMDRMQQRTDLVLANPIGEAARKRNELPKLFDEWKAARLNAAANLDTLVEKINEYDAKGDQSRATAVADLVKRIKDYQAKFAGNSDSLGSAIGVLCNKDLPDTGRRKAREDALARIQDQQRAIQAHPLTRLLATSAIAAGKAVPLRLFGGLDRLQYTILTSVE